jgi:hypothetical protein
LAGWSSSGTGDNSTADMRKTMLFDVVHYMHAGCYEGYDSDDPKGYNSVFAKVFTEIVQCECKGDGELCELPTDFGDEMTEWTQIRNFYQAWESFGSLLNFA